MIPISTFYENHVAIFGLGRSGIASALALMKGGAIVHAWDDNPVARSKAQDAGIHLTDLDKADWQNMQALILSPGIPLRHPEPHRIVKLAHKYKTPIMSDIELFARTINALPEHARPKIIGVTGTNGKSTTVALIGHILAKSGKNVHVGGNIGVSVLDLPAITADAIYVLELSSYQLEITQSLYCDIAVLLNISADHLERHNGMEGYIDAKKRIFNNQHINQERIIGFDDSFCQIIASYLSINDHQSVTTISSSAALGRGVSILDNNIYDCLSGRADAVGDISNAMALSGVHNAQNAAAAYAACRIIGLESSVIIRDMISFSGLRHRMELVGEINGIHFVNDSKATNAHAAHQALNAYEKVYWIAGGQAKSDGIGAIIPLTKRICKAYLIGAAQDQFADILYDRVALEKCGDIKTAVQRAYEDAQSTSEGAIILLSPACASFDQFKDFEARGDAFRDAVENIMDTHSLRKISA